MLGLIPLYFIGKYFSELAFQYNRSRWAYASLAIALYVVVQLAVQIPILFIMADNPDMDGGASLLLSLLAIGGGILFIWWFYGYLRRSFEQQPKPKSQQKDSELLDDLN